MSKRILVVDDTKALAHSIADTLMMEGYKVSIAYSGLQAKALLKSEKPDLIITDLVMPELDGYDFIRFVRSISRGSSVPVIIITADTNIETKNKGLSAGANLVLIKPFDDEILIDSIQSLLSHA